MGLANVEVVGCSGQVRSPASGGGVDGSTVFTETVQAWPGSDRNWRKGQHIPAKGTKKLGRGFRTLATEAPVPVGGLRC